MKPKPTKENSKAAAKSKPKAGSKPLLKEKAKNDSKPKDAAAELDGKELKVVLDPKEAGAKEAVNEAIARNLESLTKEPKVQPKAAEVQKPKNLKVIILLL